MAFSDWSTNPANNAVKPGIDWAENMLPGAVNGSARQMMADLATWRDTPTFPSGFATLTIGTLTLTNPLTVAQGGTGGTTQATARTGLGLGTMATANTADYAATTGATFTGQVDVTAQMRADFFVLRSNQAAPAVDASVFRPADNVLALGAAGAERFRVNVTGAVVTGTLGVTGNSTFNGQISRDANFSLDVVSSKPRITFDSGDYLEYDRTANKLVLVVGATAVASVDGSGNLKVLGNITAATAP